MRQGGDSRALSFVEKEAMAPCTYGGLAHGTASDGRIRLGNSEFINVNGPTPTYAIGPVWALYPRHLDATASDGFSLPERLLMAASRSSHT